MGMASQALAEMGVREWEASEFERIESEGVVRVCMQSADLTSKRREQPGLAIAGEWVGGGTTSVLEFGCGGM